MAYPNGVTINYAYNSSAQNLVLCVVEWWDVVGRVVSTKKGGEC